MMWPIVSIIGHDDAWLYFRHDYASAPHIYGVSDRCRKRRIKAKRKWWTS